MHKNDGPRPSWVGRLEDGPSVGIEQSRLLAFEKCVSALAIDKFDASPLLVSRLIEAREKLRKGHAKEENQYDEAINWSYWTNVAVRDAFRIVPILLRDKLVLEAITSGEMLQVIQFGSGPAEDLVGVLELLERLRLHKRIRYVGIDTQDWEIHWRAMRQHIESVYASNATTLEPLGKDINALEAVELAKSVRSGIPTLVISANFLVVEGDVPTPQLPSSVARLVLGIKEIVPACALLLAEGDRQQLRMKAVLELLRGPSKTNSLKVVYRPSETECTIRLGDTLKNRKQDAITASVLVK